MKPIGLIATLFASLLVDRPGRHPLGEGALAVAEVVEGSARVLRLSVVEADGRETLSFDLGPSGSRFRVFASPDGEVWAWGEVGVFGWRRSVEGPFRAIETLDDQDRPIHRLPSAFLDALPAPLRERWGNVRESPLEGLTVHGTFRIQPVRPIEEIRAESLAAKPPVETGEFLKPDLVDLATLDPRIRLEIRYAGTNNFLGVPVYTSPRAFLQRPAAEALGRVQERLASQGFGLLIHDGYRPWYVTRTFREATPPRYHEFVADPAKGSRHNRGCAVDLTLYDLQTGATVDMPTGYDEFSRCAFADYPGVTRGQARRRAALRHAMEAEGFLALPEEWWHFDYKDWARYPIQNAAFEAL